MTADTELTWETLDEWVGDRGRRWLARYRETGGKPEITQMTEAAITGLFREEGDLPHADELAVFANILPHLMTRAQIAEFLRAKAAANRAVGDVGKTAAWTVWLRRGLELLDSGEST